MTSRISHVHYLPTGNHVNHSLLKMHLCSVEKPSSSFHQKGRRSLVLCTNHIKASPKPQLLTHGCVFWPGINKAIEEAVWQGETCMRFHAQSAATPLTPTPTPLHPWQICASDIFTLDGMDYLILADFYSKVIMVHNLPADQSNSAKVIHILEEWFCDHSMPEVLCTDNGPWYASAAFVDCSIEWCFTHETSSSYYPQSNGFEESCAKIVKHTIQHTKYSGTKPRIVLQHLKATPVNAKLHSPSQMLYNQKIHNIILSRICNTDQVALLVQEHLENQAENAKSYADKCSKPLAPFWSTNCHIWHPEENLDTHYSSLCPSKEPSTTIPDATSRNAVSDAMMLSPRPHQPHQNRLRPGFPHLCHSLPQPLNEHHNQLHLWL